MKHAKHRNITLSLSPEVIHELHFFAKKRGMSHFVEEAIVEKLRIAKSSIEQQYKEAAADEERNVIFDEWNHMSRDGLNDQNDW